MARRVFFSFHYQGDVGRIGQVRNAWVTKKGDDSAQPFFDKADWEKMKKDGDEAVKRWINAQLENTSVTIVLIGTETANRRWVKYEIERSIAKKNGLIGIYIHDVEDFRKDYPPFSSKGESPFRKHFGFKPVQGRSATYPVCNYYDWVKNDGYNNIETWIEKAAKQAGR